jgi:hypothetical protein
MRRSILTAGVCILAAAVAYGEDYPDAQTLLNRLSERPAAQPTAEVDPVMAKFETEITGYNTRVAALPADESASEWLALFHRGAELSNAARNQPIGVHYHAFDDSDASGVRRALLALPPPAHWPALAKAIEARRPAKGEETARDLALNLLAALLGDNPAARKSVVAELRGSVGGEGSERLENDELDALLAQLGEETPQRDPIAAFEKQLAETPQPYLELTAPDLVKLAGR